MSLDFIAISVAFEETVTIYPFTVNDLEFLILSYISLAVDILSSYDTYFSISNPLGGYTWSTLYWFLIADCSVLISAYNSLLLFAIQACFHL